MNTFLLFFAAAFVSAAFADYSVKRRNTLLVTMRRSELVDIIINCVSASRDVNICQQFSRCESMMAPQAVKAYMECRLKLAGESWTPCRPYEVLFTDPATPAYIHDCIEGVISELTPEDRMDMVRFEMCNRELYARNCMRNHKHHGVY